MRLKLSLLLVFIITYSWSQSGTTKTFTTSGTFPVPAGVTSIVAQAWGGGGSGGGASGAPLLLGRGAAGGGGGAFASASISVTPGSTLNVVVAGETPGTSGANGTAGGNSTITGFESSILAAGGSGGAANNAGGTPVGGSGGLVANSAGAIRTAGINGGNGNSWNLLGILLSSGAGGAGGNFGGAGGPVVSGLIFSNAPGSAGSAPGGAGSGAVNSALGGAQVGGAGAAGRVIISYTCSNFSVTSTVATNVCASTGSTSTVTLTGSAASLPVGSYVVTYNRSNPSATALTANLTVSTAGTGTFTAVGLTTVGSSTITITKLTSETCSSNITANNTATITVSPDSVGGTIVGAPVPDQTDTYLLTLSGYTGSIVEWESAVSPFMIWSDVGYTGTSLNTGTLTETTQFRAIIKSGTCSIAFSTIITLEVAPTITMAPSTADRCYNDVTAQNTTLYYISTTGDPITYSIVWDVSPVNSFAAVTDAALTTSPITIVIPAGTAAGTYTGTLTVKDINGNSSVGSAFTVTIDPASVGGTVSGGTTITAGSTSGLLTLSGHTGSVVKWQSSVSPFSTWSNITNTSTTYTSGPLTETTQFRALVQSGVCDFADSVPTTVTVEDLPTITLAPSTENRCYQGGSTAQNTTLAYTGTTGDPITYSIVWDASPANSFAAVTDAALTTSPITIVIPAGTAAGTYTGTLTVKDINGNSSVGSTFNVNLGLLAFVISNGTVNPVTTSTSLQNATLAYSGTFGSPSGNPTRYNIDWNQAANSALLLDQPTSSYTFSPGGGTINTIAIPANVPPGTYTGVMHISNETSCDQSLSISITINPVLPAITLQASLINICTDGDFELSVPVNYTVTAGSPVTYSIVWNSSPANNFAAVTNAVLPASTITIAVPEGTAPGTYTGTLTVKDANGVSSSPSSFSLKTGRIPTIELTRANIDPVCASSSLQEATLFYNSTTNSPTSYSIDWLGTAIPDQPNTPFAFSSGQSYIDEIAIPANTPAGVYSGIMKIFNESCSSSDIEVSISIDALPPTPIIGEQTGPVDGKYSVSISGLLEDDWSLNIDDGQQIKSGIGTSTIVSGLSLGTHTFKQFNSLTGCFSEVASITIYPPEFTAGGNTSKTATNPITVSAFNKIISVDTPNQIIDKVYIFNVSGNLIYEKDRVSDSKLTIDNLRSGNQVLVVKVILNNNKTETRKIIF